MSITLELPAEMERRLRTSVSDLEGEAKMAVALDLFRRELITHFELGQLLGLNRFDTDRWLHERREWAQSLTLEDLEQDYQRLAQRFPRPLP